MGDYGGKWENDVMLWELRRGDNGMMKGSDGFGQWDTDGMLMGLLECLHEIFSVIQVMFLISNIIGPNQGSSHSGP